MKNSWLTTAQRIQAIAQAGLTYGESKYDLERYQELRALSDAMFSEYTNTPLEKITALFDKEIGYQTPKVDVRGVVFKDDKLLMVRETIDGCWSIPGGWADVGYSPGETATKEIQEDEIPPLSEERLTAAQVHMLFAFHQNPSQEAIFD